MKKILCELLFLLSCTCLFATSNEKHIISVRDFGLQPNSRVNAVPYVQKVLIEAKKYSESVIYFPEGRYDFWAENTIKREYFESNTYDNNPKTLAILLDSISNVTIDGGGSDFIMHGRMQPITLDNCTNITLENFSFDWEIPLTAQGKVKASNNQYMDVEIDTRQYPYIIEKGHLTFVGEGWKSEMWSIMQFDPDTHFVRYQSGDNLGWGEFRVEELKDGLVRIYYMNRQEDFPPVKTLLVLRHNSRDHAGIFIYHSENTVLKNINIYNTGGLGILSQYSRDLSFDNVNVVPNKEKNRILSGHDDGFHFMGCGGLIKVENCSWAGLMDDPVNIHGTSVRIVEIVSPTKIKCKFMHDMSQGMLWGRSGEEVGFIDNKTLRTIGKANIRKFEPLDKEEFLLELNSPIPSDVKDGFALENLTCTPDVEIRNSHFGSCRARGLLVSTPGKVLIENNIFESSGSAILIAGDANQWYESGAVTDVLIRNNEFRYPNNSSSYQFCEGVISIYPEIPEPSEAYPFHRNIRIENNSFDLFDYSVLYALSVDGLTFANNQLKRSYKYEPYHRRTDGITLEKCRNVIVSNNKISQDVLGKTVLLDGTKKSEVKLKNQEELKIVEKK